MYVHTKSRTQTDVAALFVAAKNGTRPGQPSGVNAEANSLVRTTHGTAASKGQQEGRAARGTRVRLRGGSQVTFCSPSRNDRDTDTDRCGGCRGEAGARAVGEAAPTTATCRTPW